MKKWITLLGAALAVQLVLAAIVNMNGSDHGAFKPHEPLLAFERSAVDGLRITEKEGEIELRRKDGHWVLPASEDFPASEKAVEELLDNLTDLKKGWPVATTSGAAERFKVDENDYERKLDLLSGDKAVATLYVGSSPGYRKVHVRAASGESVYAVAFDTWKAGVKADNWIDKAFLTVDESDLARIEMPGLSLERDDKGLHLVGLADDERTDEKKAAALMRKLAGLRIDGLAGPEAKSRFKAKKPELVITAVRKDGNELTYRFWKPEKAGDYVLKRSDNDRYFRVSQPLVEALSKARREELVTAAKTGPEEHPGADADQASATSQSPKEEEATPRS
jgi:hypothetical protein